jgi:hypothetical protein
MKRSKLIRHKEGDEFPEQFWNYLINPITGFYYSIRQDQHYKKKIYGHNRED